MDTLSRLLSLYPVDTSLDVRCHFGAPWLLDHPAEIPGVAPYHLIVNGNALLDVGSLRNVPMHAGDIALFPGGAAHRLHVGPKNKSKPLREVPGNVMIKSMENGGAGATTDILCGRFLFDAHGSQALLKAMPEVIIVHSAEREDLSGLRTLLSLLRAETDTTRPGTGIVIAQLSSALFALVMRAWVEQGDTPPSLFGLLSEPRLQACVYGMLSAPEQAWTLELMAEKCNMSRATFARLFTRSAGAPPATVLTQIRMAIAAQLIVKEKGKRGIGDIAADVGYQSESAFNRVFKRFYSIGPGQYRRRAATIDSSPSEL